MTLRLQPDQRTGSAWRALWEIVEGRLTEDSLRSAQAATSLMPYVQDHPAHLIVVAVDAIVDTIVEWADQIGKNPACLAETCFTMLHAQSDPPARLLLLAASQTLLAVDPTGEAGTPHPVCHPWPPHATVASLATAGGGEVLRQMLEAAQQTHGLEQQPVLVVINTAPAVLTNVLWGQSGSNPDRMRQLLDSRRSLR
ncbi:hypothetical protein GCM10010168_76520 [Actinoplanes ianthinogenes]|uniref:Uncharacterized protein n=1 Tax=Actinoplanes ianthinogenes TaxID=122358 RepID=A0ABM7M9W2_9ACTN|nr:hypothetical protein [Actinoplanes ianthinogenes]BCJ48422.1 hypothetical protein Aiant_90790 [Actinoplanes ianthinogenes]GGR46502.1 hypothetical protein GCM10010168_76520 [Actinoplanes ianthinogenes]